MAVGADQLASAAICCVAARLALGAEGLAADTKRNIYGGEVGAQKLTKYVLAKP